MVSATGELLVDRRSLLRAAVDAQSRDSKVREDVIPVLAGNICGWGIGDSLECLDRLLRLNTIDN